MQNSHDYLIYKFEAFGVIIQKLQQENSNISNVW